MKKIFNKLSEGFKKVISAIKKKWLVNMTTTVILMAIFIGIFILITTVMKSLNLNPIDITSQGINSITQETKEKLSNIDKEVKILMMNFTENDNGYKLAMQYKNVNKNIDVELIDLSARADLAQTYNVNAESGPTIVITYNGKSKTIKNSEMYTYDYNTYDTIDLTEETITSAIVNLIAEKLSNVYIIDNYCSEYFTTKTYMSGLSEYMGKEALNINELDLLVTGKVPDDCDLLLIVSPIKDFEAQVADEIINYINKGGNILWLQGAYGNELNLPNIQKVLDAYGIKPFTPGYILETNSQNTLSGFLDAIVLNVNSNEIIGNENLKALFLDATKINVSDEETLKNLKVTKTDILIAEETAIFRKDFTSSSANKIDSDEQGNLLLGAMFEKEITSDNNTVKSKLIMYADDYFASKVPYSQYYSDGWIDLYNNKDLVLNTSLYLTDSDVNISIRKATNTEHFVITDNEFRIILSIIFIIPILIIIFGVVVWQIRRKKK